MKVSRAQQAGRRQGETINEMVNLMHQKNTQANFFKGLEEVVGKDSICFTCSKKYHCIHYHFTVEKCSIREEEKVI